MSSSKTLFLSLFIFIGLISCDSKPVNPPSSSDTKTDSKGEEKSKTTTPSENKTEKTEKPTEGNDSNSSTTTENSSSNGSGTETKKDPQKSSETNSADTSSETTSNTSGSYQESVVSDGGRLQGKVLFAGEKPKLAPFPISKDQDCCGIQKPNHRLQLSASNEVKNALLILEGVKVGKKWGKLDRKLDQKDCVYEPFIQVMETGKRLKIVNSDPILHNVHGYYNGKGVFNLAMPLPGQSINQKLEDVGLYDISCDAGHSWMSSYVYVSDHPYVVISDAEGNFSIDEIPPGEYLVKLWHAGWEVKSEIKDSNGTVSGYKYATPFTSEKTVKIEAGQEASITFEIK